LTHSQLKRRSVQLAWSIAEPSIRCRVDEDISG
jgi:hypothetical protein